MNEIYNKLDQIKENLDNLEIFEKLNKSIDDIKLNKELIDKIKKYNETKDERLRLEIYNYKEIQNYKELENEINLLILHINQELKIIKSDGGCNNACN